MKKLFPSALAFLAISFIVFEIWAAPANAGKEVVQPGLTFIKSSEGGRLYRADKFDIVVLTGTYREMGRQYGALVGDKIRRFYEAGIENEVIKRGGLSYDQLKTLMTDNASKGFGKRQKDILLGMSETSGLSLEKLYMVNMNLSAILLLRKVHGGTLGACTSMAAWGEFSRDGQLYTARDFDFPSCYRTFAENFGTLVVFRPTDGSNAVAMLGLSGMVSFTDAFNSKGLYVEWNNGAFSAGLVMTGDRPSMLNSIVDLLFEADDPESFNTRLMGMRTDYPIILMLAAPSQAWYYEMSLETIKRRASGEPGLIVAANLFMHPGWEYLELPQSVAWFSSHRSGNFKALATARKGSIDVDGMKAILDTPLFAADGTIGKGAAVLERVPAAGDEATAFQVIASPAMKRMWLRIPTVTGWVPVDLARLFAVEK